MEENQDATCGDAMNAMGISRPSVQRLIKRAVELKPLRTIQAKRGGDRPTK